jgi:hypothetical protein
VAHRSWPSEAQEVSILKYGEAGAYEMARAARETALQALATQTFLPLPLRHHGKTAH